jgi:hypothetical protein
MYQSRECRGQVLAVSQPCGETVETVLPANPGSLLSTVRCFPSLLQHEPRAVSPSYPRSFFVRRWCHDAAGFAEGEALCEQV